MVTNLIYILIRPTGIQGYITCNNKDISSEDKLERIVVLVTIAANIILQG